jgi:hypothetical protein
MESLLLLTTESDLHSCPEGRWPTTKVSVPPALFAPKDQRRRSKGVTIRRGISHAYQEPFGTLCAPVERHLRRLRDKQGQDQEPSSAVTIVEKLGLC